MRQRAGRFALAALGGLLEALALPLVVPGLSLRQVDPSGFLEPLAWVGLVPALLALRAATGPLEAALLGLTAGAAAFYAAIYWVSHAMTAFGGLSQGVAFVGLSALVLYMAAHWAAAFWASFTIGRRTGWPQWIHLPVLWVATEFSRNYLFTGFPWGNLGYTQVRNGPVAQLASLGGVYAVAGLVVLVNCAAAAWWGTTRAGGGAPRPWRATAVAAAALAGTLAYGTWHLSAVRARDGPGTLGEGRPGPGQREPGGEEPGAAIRRADRRADVAAHARGRPAGGCAGGLARGLLAPGAAARPPGPPRGGAGPRAAPPGPPPARGHDRAVDAGAGGAGPPGGEHRLPARRPTCGSTTAT